MKWYDLTVDLNDTLSADSALTALVPAADIVFSGQRAHAAPSIEITVASDTQREIDEPVVVQFDVFSTSVASVAAIETRVRELVTSDLPIDIGGETMWALFAGGRSLPGPDDGVASRSFDVEYRLIRHPAEHL